MSRKIYTHNNHWYHEGQQMPDGAVPASLEIEVIANELLELDSVHLLETHRGKALGSVMRHLLADTEKCAPVHPVIQFSGDLRDYFAAAALPECIKIEGICKAAIEQSYWIADAMISAKTGGAV